jgi:hypothetical protein
MQYHNISHWRTGKAASCVGLSDGSCFGEALLLTNEARRGSPSSTSTDTATSLPGARQRQPPVIGRAAAREKTLGRAVD